VAFPASWLRVVETLARVRLLGVLIFADKRIRILLLVKIAESMIDFSMFALVSADYQELAQHFGE
jgi:hypothetical protein